MAQIDDLKAAIALVAGKVDAVDTKLDGVRAGVTAVAAEVKDLIDRLGTGAVDLTGAIADLTAIGTHLDSVGTEVDEAQSGLQAIPPAP